MISAAFEFANFFRSMSVTFKTLVLFASLFLAAGCVGSNSKSASAGQPGALGPGIAQAEVSALGDTYLMIMVQAYDDLLQRSQRPEVIDWVWQHKIATALAVVTNASTPNEYVSMLDMVTFISLRRSSVEDYWVPTLLHEEGDGILRACKDGEAHAWQAAARTFTPAQLEELRRILDKWRSEHPEQHYVSHIRFRDFVIDQGLNANSPQVKRPGSVLGLLFLDPLAGLDPVAQEIRNSREMLERMAFVTPRLPIILGWQIQYTAMRATTLPQVVRVVDSAQQVSAAADRIARTAATLPQEISTERQAAVKQVFDSFAVERNAAIEQLAAEMTTQRKDLLHDVDQQVEGLRTVMADAQRVVDHAADAGASINLSTTATLQTTEEASRRLLDHAFVLAMILVLTLLIGLPLATYLSHRLRTRPSTQIPHRS